METTNTEIKKRILITEDDKTISNAYAQSFSRAGFDVLQARNGAEALRMLKEEHPDLMILDIVMAGKDGFQVLRDAKNMYETKNIPIMILSNLGEEADVSRGKKLGAVDYLVKANHTIHDVIQRIQKELGIELKQDPEVRPGPAKHTEAQADGSKKECGGVTIKSRKAKKETETMQPEEKKEELLVDGRKPKILLTEDDEFIAKAYKDGLSRAGFEVYVARDGEDALRVLEREAPDLMLLDIIMAGKNGFEVLAEIKKRKSLKDVPIIILSNLGQESDKEKGEQLGADDYLVKSEYSMKDVIERVKKHIRKKAEGK